MALFLLAWGIVEQAISTGCKIDAMKECREYDIKDIKCEVKKAC